MVLLPYIDRCPYYLVYPIFILEGTASTTHTVRCLPCSGHGYNERLKTVKESSLPNQQHRDAFSKQSMFSFILLQSMWLTKGPRGDLRPDLVSPCLVQTSKLSTASRIFQAIRLFMRNGHIKMAGHQVWMTQWHRALWVEVQKWSRSLSSIRIMEIIYHNFPVWDQ